MNYYCEVSQKYKKKIKLVKKKILKNILQGLYKAC